MSNASPHSSSTFSQIHVSHVFDMGDHQRTHPHEQFLLAFLRVAGLHFEKKTQIRNQALHTRAVMSAYQEAHAAQVMAHITHVATSVHAESVRC
jgi:hypothetical protein